MRKPKRSDEKYWDGTHKFNEMEYGSNLDEYICYLEERKVNRFDAFVGEGVSSAGVLLAEEFPQQYKPVMDEAILNMKDELDKVLFIIDELGSSLSFQLENHKVTIERSK